MAVGIERFTSTPRAYDHPPRGQSERHRDRMFVAISNCPVAAMTVPQWRKEDRPVADSLLRVVVGDSAAGCSGSVVLCGVRTSVGVGRAAACSSRACALPTPDAQVMGVAYRHLGDAASPRGDSSGHESELATHAMELCYDVLALLGSASHG